MRAEQQRMASLHGKHLGLRMEVQRLQRLLDFHTRAADAALRCLPLPPPDKWIKVGVGTGGSRKQQGSVICVVFCVPAVFSVNAVQARNCMERSWQICMFAR